MIPLYQLLARSLRNSGLAGPATLNSTALGTRAIRILPMNGQSIAVRNGVRLVAGEFMASASADDVDGIETGDTLTWQGQEYEIYEPVNDGGGMIRFGLRKITL